MTAATPMGEDLNEIDGIGEAVTGAMIAATVEPKAGADGHFDESACLNCGAQLTGAYCAVCGQRAHVHRTLGAFGHDILHGVLHFEGKFWRTLPLLVFKPGQLTRRYILGERAKFVSPVALFLFSVFVTFAVFSFAGSNLDLNGIATADLRTDLAETVAAEENNIAELKQERTTAAPNDVPAVDRKIAEAESDLSTLRKIEKDGIAGATAGELKTSGVVQNSKGSDGVRIGNAYLQNAWDKAREHPDLIAYKLQNLAYKFAWLLIPISLPFVWLLFPFSQRFRLYDHTIFVTYSLSFMLMLVLVSFLAVLAGIGNLAGWLTMTGAVHMGAQLKGAYSLSWPGTLVRLPFLYLFCALSALIWIGLLVVMGVAG
jgi:hypothetical protein